MADIELDAPGLAKLTAQVAAALRLDAELRQLRSANEMLAQGFDPFNIAAGTHYVINEARQKSQVKYAFLVLVFESGSGLGRFRLDGMPPTTTVGIEIPAGYSVYTIPGYQNIFNFDMTAQGATNVIGARYLLL